MSITGRPASGKFSIARSVAMPWNLMDQFGETVRFYDFCDHVIVMVCGAFS